MEIRTANAMMPDDLALDDYRAIYEELKQGRSLRGFVQYIGSTMSHATWDKYEKDATALTRRMKQELRKAVQHPPLPPTVEEAMIDVDQNATVAVLDASAAPLDMVVVGNRQDQRFRLLEQKTPVPSGARVRAKLPRPYASPDDAQRFARLGLRSWRAVLDAGLTVLEISAGVHGAVEGGGGRGEKQGDQQD